MLFNQQKVDSMGAHCMLDKIYSCFSDFLQGKLFFIYDIKEDTARWSQTGVRTFQFRGEYVKSARQMLTDLVEPSEKDHFNRFLDHIISGSNSFYTEPFQLKSKDGNYITCDFKISVVRDYAQRPAYLVTTMINRSHSIRNDTVTDLPNRFELLEELHQKQEYRRRSILLMIGAINFARLNRLYGYSVGNQILKELSGKLKNMLGNGAEIYRTQGASMAALSEAMSLQEARNCYKKLREYAARYLKIHNYRIPLEICAGVVVIDDFSVDEHTLYTCARYALGRSEQDPKHELVVIHNDNVGEKRNTLKIIHTLRDSILNDCDGYYLAYQPMVTSSDGQLAGVEVLLRYDKPPFGNIPPMLFLPAIVQDEAFQKLGYWIIEKACTEGKILTKRYPKLMLHLNIANEQFQQSRFRHMLLDILNRTGFPANNLFFELSERCKQLNPMFLKDEILFLKSCGIKTALDGSSLTSLDLMRQLPVDMVKIGRELTAHLENSRADRYMLEAITGFAAHMDIQVAVEGVENERIRDILQNYPTTSYQGYYYSEAVRLEDLQKLPLFRSKKAK